MLPDPLHPAIVHLPIALAVLLPLASGAFALAVARGWLPLRSWVLVVALHALLVGATWAALETGESEEERVERVVPEAAIETHEERAELFLWLSVGALAVSGAGLLGGTAGAAARGLAVAAGLALLGGGMRGGHSGGELVYVHGAASAYARGGAAAGALAGEAAGAPGGGAPERGEGADED